MSINVCTRNRRKCEKKEMQIFRTDDANSLLNVNKKAHSKLCSKLKTTTLSSSYAKKGRSKFSNRPHFSREVGRARGEKRVNHSSLARDLQALLVFFQHLKCVYYTGEPTENAGCFFYETSPLFSKKENTSFSPLQFPLSFPAR